MLRCDIGATATVFWQDLLMLSVQGVEVYRDLACRNVS